MASSDSKSGGDLYDMAAEGTSMPNDAGKMNTIPSVPRPDQIPSENDLGSTDLAGVADNANDIPRSTRDQGLGGSSIITAAGDTLPAQTASKRMHDVPGGVVHDDAAKGSSRYEKHKRQEGSDQELGAGEGPGVDTPLGREEQSVDGQRDAVESKQI